MIFANFHISAWLGDEIGRLARLKILWEQSRVGSIPTRATNFSPKVNLKVILTPIFIFLFFSCSGAPTKPVENANSITEFLKDTPFTHFTSSCRVYDFDGRFVTYANGGNGTCIIEPDGSHYSRSSKSLQYVSPNPKLSWQNPIPRTHHLLYHSEVSGNFLALHSDFKNWAGKDTRFDVLLVLNKNGRVIKKFSFYDFLKKNPGLLRNRTPAITYWYYKQVGIEKSNFELTHANSFLELTRKNADGTTEVLGYAVNCTLQSKFYVLNASLSQVIKIIDLNERSTHSVSQIDNDRLLFYRNSDAKTLLSSAETYNLTTNQFTTVYKSNDKYLSSTACSSAQLLTADKLMISHSQCISSENKADYGVAVELIDLKEKKSFFKILHKSTPHSNAYLIDGKKFVELNPPL